MADQLVNQWNESSFYERIQLIASFGLSMRFGRIDMRNFDELDQRDQIMLIHTAQAVGMI